MVYLLTVALRVFGITKYVLVSIFLFPYGNMGGRKFVCEKIHVFCFRITGSETRYQTQLSAEQVDCEAGEVRCAQVPSLLCWARLLPILLSLATHHRQLSFPLHRASQAPRLKLDLSQLLFLLLGLGRCLHRYESYYVNNKTGKV